MDGSDPDQHSSRNRVRRTPRLFLRPVDPSERCVETETRALWHKLPTEVVVVATRNVVMTEHQDALIASLIKEGRFQHASEVLRAGLRLVEPQERAAEATVQALRAAAPKGRDAPEARRIALVPER